MKHFALALLLVSSLTGCQHSPDAVQNAPTKVAAPGPAQPTQSTAPPDSVSASPPLLALASNALQLVSQPTGSTREIPFGMPQGELVDVVTKVLQAKPRSIGINTECGAGPLKMASWSNGLTLVFQEKKSGAAKEWQFVGWYAGAASGVAPKVATMAGSALGLAGQHWKESTPLRLLKRRWGRNFPPLPGCTASWMAPAKRP
jgi:hypothetical protein